MPELLLIVFLLQKLTPCIQSQSCSCVYAVVPVSRNRGSITYFSPFKMENIFLIIRLFSSCVYNDVPETGILHIFLLQCNYFSQCCIRTCTRYHSVHILVYFSYIQQDRVILLNQQFACHFYAMAEELH